MANLDEHHIDRLIGGLYEAATIEGLWAAWLESTARFFGSDSGLSVVRDTRSGAVDLLGAHNHSPDSLRLYGEYYHQCDLWTERSARTLMKATISADLCSDEEFANSEIYVDFSRPHAGDLFYVVGAVLPVEKDIGIIGFQNTRKAGPFDRLHARALDRLLPHLQRALGVRATLKKAAAQNAASEAVLETLVHGVALVSLDGMVLYANAAASAILAKADGLSIGLKGGLVAARPDGTRALRSAIASCASMVGGGALALVRPSGLRPLEVIVVPLSGTASPKVHGRTGAILFLRDPESQLQPLPELLAGLYRLTPAEARLAAGLVSYLTLEQIAAQHRLGRETLKTQLRELFRKTGTSRQAELVGFLASGVAALLQRRRID